MAVELKFRLNENFYLRDPQDTKLGRKIIEKSILLIDEIGFEAFTFRKLAHLINSTEASIYRYFENKHLLLVYLVSWYWEWVSYLIDFNTMNIKDPIEKLGIAISTVVAASQENEALEYVNENILHRIVISESTKAYHTKNVDAENKEGFFLSYKLLAERLASIFLEVNPTFPYPRALASNMLEMANHQIYFAEHLPRLTDLSKGNYNFNDLIEMIEYFVFKSLDGSFAKVQESS